MTTEMENQEEPAAAQRASSAASSAAAVEKIKDDSAVSAAAALASEKAAKTSESNAKTSETNAASSKTAAAASASAAKTSETNAKASETNAKASETNAKSSETAARGHAEDAEAAQSAIENMTVSVKTLAPGSNATATKTTVGNVVNIEYGIPRGEQGQGFKILGYYDNLSALQSGVPSPNIGDAYGIGTASPYDIYIWDGKAWKNNGPIQGPAGQKGEDGTDGRAATVRVGTVTTGAPGSNATVNNSGTQSDAVLDFTIPRGTNGQNGADGADGENGGYYSPAVDASGNLTWTASKSGMPSVSGANIRGPQGNDGAPGQKGDPGSAGVDGKSAYQSAKENGYTGTEAEFYAALVSMKDAPFLPTSGGVMKQGAKIAFESDSGPSVYVNRQNGDLTITKNTYVNVKLGSSGVELLAAKGLSSTKLIASTDGSIQLLPAGKTVNCGSSKLSAVENPTEDTDAATKGYVDSLVGQIGTTLDSINGEVV